MTRAHVAVVRCDTYDEDTVEAAVGRGLELIGGAGRFARAGERILLKPNFLVASAPDDAVTTHPSVFRAAARLLMSTGAALSYGDSPGFGSAAGAARKGGVAQVARAEGVELADFTTGKTVSFPNGGLIKQFEVAEAVLEADGLVTLPKLKAHGLTRMTGAVKNQLGCVPGTLKGQWHARVPDVKHFCQMLVDLNRLIEPRLVIMDAVVAMEGNGPRNGDPRKVGAVIVADDPVAADAVACRIMDLDTGLVDTVVFGEQWGLGTATEIELVGDPLDEFVVPDFVVNRGAGSTTGGPGRVSGFFKQYVVPKPVIDTVRCTACGTCVDVCPIDPKAVAFADDEARRAKQPPVHDYDTCIRCYCCQELCPERAIDISTPFLGRLLRGR